MSKKQSKAHRDKHSRGHRKHKRESEKLLEEIGAKKLKIDKNACGDCPEPPVPANSVQRSKGSKEEDPKGDESGKGPKFLPFAQLEPDLTSLLSYDFSSNFRHW